VDPERHSAGHAVTAAPLAVRRLRGLVPYADALALQREAHAARRAGTGPDTLLLLEHAPVVTIGPRTETGDLRIPEPVLRAHGVEVVETDRGGGITWHGPGQAVAYPILDLRAWGLGPRDYLRFLEGLVIGVLADLGVEAGTVEGRTGVWVANAKVCALGVRVAGGVSLHGLALNVAPDLAAFDAIVPCGIRDAGVTSLEGLLGRAPSMDDVFGRIEEAFLRAAPRRGRDRKRRA
jgi:lipoyl(octanoyl) transferase